jgi:ribosome maturation factor RimP
MFETEQAELETFLTQRCQESSLELFDLLLKHAGKTVQLEVIIDHPHGGITIDECTKVNKALTKFLEDRPLFGDDYTVEVSSPGLDRPLKNKKDFTRVMRRNVRFHLSEMLDHKKEHSGIIEEVSDQEVKINTKTKTLTVPFIIINKAVQVI